MSHVKLEIITLLFKVGNMASTKLRNFSHE